MQDPILDNLNQQQREAVIQKDGPILIIAGAGSGKTRVLTSKIALLLRDGVDPHEILALTFTKKAAGEMRERIYTITGDKSASSLVMGTFHSVFVRFLREYHMYIGFPSNFTILDEDDAESCLKDCIGEVLFGVDWNDKQKTKELSEDEKKQRKHLLQVYKTRDIASRISLLKNDYVLPKDYFQEPSQMKYDTKKNRPELGRIYELYMKRCRRNASVDFDDILVYTRFLLDRYPEVAKTIARRFRYILVDEYQDTNAIQYSIILTLSQAHGNICAVGDDSQSIYAFRGARIQNILNFRLDFPDHKAFKLETNYRSTPQIVEAANRLIDFNINRLPKHCVASRQDGVPIDVQYLRDDRDEARFITATIKRRHDSGSRYSDFAVLYRTNAQARALEDALLRGKVPYVIYSGISFFERQEIKDAIAYMRLVVNHDDDEAFKRICNRPARGISDATLSTLQVNASTQDRSIFSVARFLVDNPLGLKPTAVRSVLEFVRAVDELTSLQESLDAIEAVQEVLTRSGLYELYSKENDDDGRKRTANLDELLNGVRYYVQDQRLGDTYDLPDESLAGYLENIALLSAVDKKDDGKDKVALMTSHCSKGLEFPTVFIAGCEEGLYPAIRESSTEEELEEERRLFYVSLTRAKNEAILTTCYQRWKYGEVNDCTQSRFINEMFNQEEP